MTSERSNAPLVLQSTGRLPSRRRADSGASLHVPQRRKEAGQEVRRMLGAVAVPGHFEGPSAAQRIQFSEDLSESILMGQLAQQRRQARGRHDVGDRPSNAGSGPIAGTPNPPPLGFPTPPFRRRPRVRHAPPDFSPLEQLPTSRFSDPSSCEGNLGPEQVSRFSDASSMSAVSSESNSLFAEPNELRARPESSLRRTMSLPSEGGPKNLEG